MQHDEQWKCVKGWCAAHWRVLAVPSVPKTWQIVSDEGGSWTVAAQQPICPRCGSDLHEIMTGVILDIAPVLYTFS